MRLVIEQRRNHLSIEFTFSDRDRDCGTCTRCQVLQRSTFQSSKVAASHQAPDRKKPSLSRVDNEVEISQKPHHFKQGFLKFRGRIGRMLRNPPRKSESGLNGLQHDPWQLRSELDGNFQVELDGGGMYWEMATTSFEPRSHNIESIPIQEENLSHEYHHAEGDVSNSPAPLHLTDQGWMALRKDGWNQDKKLPEFGPVSPVSSDNEINHDDSSQPSNLDNENAWLYDSSQTDIAVSPIDTALDRCGSIPSMAGRYHAFTVSGSHVASESQTGFVATCVLPAAAYNIQPTVGGLPIGCPYSWKIAQPLSRPSEDTNAYLLESSIASMCYRYDPIVESAAYSTNRVNVAGVSSASRARWSIPHQNVKASVNPPTMSPPVKGPFQEGQPTDHPHVLLVIACDQCSEKFHGTWRKTNLARHKKQMHIVEGAQAPSFTCHQCKKAFRRGDALKKHEWTKHKIGARPKERGKQGNRTARRRRGTTIPPRSPILLSPQ